MGQPLNKQLPANPFTGPVFPTLDHGFVQTSKNTKGTAQAETKRMIISRNCECQRLAHSNTAIKKIAGAVTVDSATGRKTRADGRPNCRVAVRLYSGAKMATAIATNRSGPLSAKTAITHSGTN